MHNLKRLCTWQNCSIANLNPLSHKKSIAVGVLFFSFIIMQMPSPLKKELGLFIIVDALHLMAKKEQRTA
uniref:Uncharacterized protein n=1 Tax=Vibrio genomosp. F6 TaxID=723172 RepID=A0A0H3ZZM3_9VIBR|nr:hypothetical protein [Vibrio genomosp. F6]